MKKRIVIVDDHASVRDMLVCLLRREDVYEVVGEAGSGLCALKVCSKVRPDLVILDLMLPELCGTEVLRRLHTSVPQTRTLIYSGTLNEVLIAEALRSRPNGFVEKADGLPVLREAISTVMGGGSYFTPTASRFLHDSPTAPQEAGRLTEREREILQMIAEGRSGKEISGRLGVSTKTVENHRQHLMGKLGIHHVAGLTLFAVRCGMVMLE